MKFSTKSRYALRLMAELARYAPGTTVSLKEISERQNLSLKYLEQIVTPLARVGLVKSERGSQGGYRLTKAPADYTAGEILRAIEGSVAPIPCLGSETNECPMWEQCFTLPFWAGLDEVINQYIDSVTLEQLASQPGSIGFLLPAMGKDQLFPTVIFDGALPRKTFSMGEAHDKRFYLEARRIK